MQRTKKLWHKARLKLKRGLLAVELEPQFILSLFGERQPGWVVHLGWYRYVDLSKPASNTCHLLLPSLRQNRLDLRLDRVGQRLDPVALHQADGHLPQAGGDVSSAGGFPGVQALAVEELGHP